jgi:hypothetical protein
MIHSFQFIGYGGDGWDLSAAAAKYGVHRTGKIAPRKLRRFEEFCAIISNSLANPPRRYPGKLRRGLRKPLGGSIGERCSAHSFGIVGGLMISKYLHYWPRNTCGLKHVI